MHEVDEPIEGDDTAGDVLLVRGDEAMDEAVERVQREVRARSDATGVRIWGGEWHLIKEVTFRSGPDESPAHEAAESIPDRVQRQVGEALLVLDAAAEEIRAVGLALVDVGKNLGDEDHDRMLHWATELAGIRREARRVEGLILQRKPYLNVRSATQP